MKIVNFSEQNSIVNQYLAEMRDVDYQKNRLLFRNNIQRIGELEAYEISKTLDYEARNITTPLGTSSVQVPTDKIVLATIFRAGLPFHNGFLNIFDHAGNAFVSAYREYVDEQHTKVGIHVEYLATPNIEGKNLIIADPMLATGGSMELGYKAFLTKGTPKRIHVACVIASSFARIFYRNAINIGLPILECAEAAEAIEAGDEVAVDFSTGVIEDLTTGAAFQALPFPEFIQNIIDHDGLFNALKARAQADADED